MNNTEHDSDNCKFKKFGTCSVCNLKKMKIEYFCPKCSWINKPTEKSNKNWKVINTSCDKCGEKCELKINDKTI